MPIDVEKFTKHLRKKAKSQAAHHGECAKWVRLALEAGGADTTGHLVPAKTYGPILLRNGFHEMTVDDLDTFLFMKGDVVVIEPTKHGNQNGHIAGFDGKEWISDFVQREFWPGPDYRKERPEYVIYRP
jgi:hypothetical protein